MEINKIVKELVTYARVHLHMKKIDELYFENILLHRFNVINPYKGEIDEKQIKQLDRPDCILNELKQYLLENGEEDKNIDRVLVEVMGMISPNPSIVIDTFEGLKKEDDKYALAYLYDLSIKNYYIRKTDIDRNLKWKYQMKDNYLEITINLSKPEKNNKDIAKLLKAKTTDKYPQCLLCKENLGFGGTDSHPARENIRIIPMRLNDDNWFMQYSPYAYYDEHCIVINEKHQPMKISKSTFMTFIDFVDYLPEYFIGSNADLPIVGGSILNHEHYQGGKHLMPLMFAKDRFTFKTNKYPHTLISYLNWFNSCIKLVSSSKEEMINAMEDVRASWKNYDSSINEIVSHDDKGEHNTITPIMRKIGNEYVSYMILRNNRTNEMYPDGIFHAHPEYHNIKKEGIGLIEAMGLFILPARLKRQSENIANILKENKFNFDQYYDENQDMLVHKDFIELLIKKYGVGLSKEKAHEAITSQINEICMHILENTAVFKNTEIGNESAKDFIEEVFDK